MTANEQYPDLTVYARIDVSGAVDLMTEGVASRTQLASVEDARQLVTKQAWDVAVQRGQEVRLDTADPDGRWLFLVRPDGSVVEAPPLADVGDPVPEQPLPQTEEQPAYAEADQPVEAQEDEPAEPPADEEPVVEEQPVDEVEHHDPDQTAVIERTTDETAVAEDQPYEHVDENPDQTPDWVEENEVGPAYDALWRTDEDTQVRPRHAFLDEQADVATEPTAPPPAVVPFAAPPAALVNPAEPVLSATPGAPVQPPRAAPMDAWQAPARPRRSQADAEPARAATPRRALPTLDDLLEGRPALAPGPASTGWRGAVRKASFGLIKPAPSEDELRHRAAVATIQRSLTGPRTVVVVNPKGGASKTTATMLLAATFATHRGGYTLAWDNNETRGTLGWRALPTRHTNTAVNLLADLDRFQHVGQARVGDLDNYVRAQGSSQFDVLASDEDASASASIEADAFNRLHATLSRFYRILVIDTGNNMRASNWDAAVQAADQLVIVSTLREDTAASAAWLVDGLRAKGFENKVRQAVTVLAAPSHDVDYALRSRLHEHFGQLTRAVVDVPHDAALVSGGTIEVSRLSPATREAWVTATAAVAEGL